MIIAEVAIFPTSEGSSVSRYVKEVLRVLEASGLKTQTGAMATVIEAPDLATLFGTIAQADAALASMGVGRIHIDLRVDHRLDKEASMASKLAAVGKG
ncbi:MAG: MTH1187 family thiamine-binding protein [Candidatus Aminicenantes bacterium]|nr:MTH1187 family thiamine-binding protein [Candidatus Aminicenantes bacterium]